MSDHKEATTADNAVVANVNVNDLSYLTTTGTNPYANTNFFQANPSYLLTCTDGHIGTEWVRLSDETWQCRCQVCGVLFRSTSIPDSVNLTDIKELLGEIMGLVEGVDLDGFDISDTLGRFKALKEKVDAKAYEVRQIERLVDLAETLIEQKVKSEV